MHMGNPPSSLVPATHARRLTSCKNMLTSLLATSDFARPVAYLSSFVESKSIFAPFLDRSSVFTRYIHIPDVSRQVRTGGDGKCINGIGGGPARGIANLPEPGLCIGAAGREHEGRGWPRWQRSGVSSFGIGEWLGLAKTAESALRDFPFSSWVRDWAKPNGGK